MQRYLLLAFTALLAASLGGATGYYFGRHRVDTEYLHFAKISITGYQLEDGTHDALIMTLLAEGRANDAYTLAEGRALTAFQYLHYWPPSNETQAQQSRAFTSNVGQFYRQYADRRKALSAEDKYQPPNLLKWIDGEP